MAATALPTAISYSTSTSQTAKPLSIRCFNNNDNSISRTNNINHRFDFNLEYRMDTLNYLKVNPSFLTIHPEITNTDILTTHVTKAW
jgi:hypothetical protein